MIHPFGIDWSKLRRVPEPDAPKNEPLPTFLDKPREYEWKDGKMVPK